MKKQAYQTPEMEITRFQTEDIIRTSGYNDYGTDIMKIGNMKVGNDLFYGSDSGLS